MMKLMLVITIKDMNTQKTIPRYIFRILGLFYWNIIPLVFAIAADDDPIEELDADELTDPDIIPISSWS